MHSRGGDLVALRQLVLAVCVLDDVDLRPDDHGVELPGRRPVHVPWDSLRGCVAPQTPTGAPADLGGDLPADLLAQPDARRRTAAFLRGVRRLADADPQALAALVRPVGFPAGSPEHPGAAWVVVRVLGGALDLGLGVLDLLGDPDRVDVLPAGAARLAGRDDSSWWPAAAEYLDRMGSLAAECLPRDISPGTLRPMGDCDCVTLLGSAALRRALVAGYGGLRAVAVPMRRRGWTDVRRIDPAFAAAAAMATDPSERGFPRLVLVTADEVVLAADADGTAADLAREQLPSQGWHPDAGGSTAR